MKLEKTGKQDLDTDRTIYELVVDEFGDRLPIMKNIPRDEDSVHINFRCYGSVNKIANKIAAKSPHFSCISEVHRAAHYLGMRIIPLIVFGDDSEHYIHKLLKSIAYVEKYYLDYQMIDDTLKVCEKLHKAYRAGVASEQEFKRGMNKIMSNLPVKLRENAKRKTQLLLGGAKVSSLMESRGRGRPSDNVLELNEI